MNVALIDDDKKQIEKLSKLISNELSLVENTPHKLKSYNNSETFFATWQKDHFDLIILDIFIDGITGIDIARRIRETDKEVQLVFCSSSNEFASESYEVNAQYYLQKPVSETDIANMFRRLRFDFNNLTKTVQLPDGHSIILRSILYTDYANHVITIHMKNDETYRLRTSHTQIESLLHPYGYFISPFKGIIVNLYEVSSFLDDTFVLHNGQTLPVARRRTKEVKDAYTKFLFNKLRKEIEKN